MRESYQKGNINLIERKTGPSVWVFRYYEYDLDGKRHRRSIDFSDTEECPTQAQAERKAEPIRQKVNNDLACVFFSNLADRFEREELPAKPERRPRTLPVKLKTESTLIRPRTAASYRSNLNRLRKKWGTSRLDWMTSNTAEIERWFITLKKGDQPTIDLAHKTKHNIKALLHVMFERAMQWNYLNMQRNPVDVVRIKGVSRKRRSIPTVTLEEIGKLLSDEELSRHVWVMIQMAMCLGLGVSELLGLRWEDIDFETEEIHIQRSSVGKDQGETKTDNRNERLPMHETLASLLKWWRQEQEPVNGWLFGSLITGRPFHADSLREDHLQPACVRTGLPEIGWHSFRHTYRALLGELGEALEVQQYLMRHAHIGTTMDYGKRSAGRAKLLRAANARVVEMLPLQKRG